MDVESRTRPREESRVRTSALEPCSPPLLLWHAYPRSRWLLGGSRRTGAADHALTCLRTDMHVPLLEGILRRSVFRGLWPRNVRLAAEMELLLKVGTGRVCCPCLLENK